jgi:hypothetical protein
MYTYLHIVKSVTTDQLRKQFGRESVTHFIVYKTPDDGQNDLNMWRSNI